MEFLTLKHSMPAGDLLSILPGLRQVWKDTGKKWIIFQRVNLEYGDMFEAYPGVTYSIKKDNIPVTMNRGIFDALKPLLLAQPYIKDVFEWDGENCDYDMDLLRQMDTTMPFGSINRWPSYIWPEMACDLSERWLLRNVHLFDGLSDKIIINRTERYTNMLISYRFLKDYEDKLVFMGLPHEYKLFCKQFGLNMPIFPERQNFNDISVSIQSCKLYIGNQSACFQIAEGHKVNRILETCRQIPNVIGSGPGFYDFLHQDKLEYFVNKLYNE
jgi:hypothetical protein